MKNLKLLEKAGKSSDSPVVKTIIVKKFPNDFDELVAVVETPEQKNMVFNLFEAAFSSQAKRNCKDGDKVDFLDLLAIRRKASAQKVRETVLAQMLQDGQELASGEIDMATFQARLAQHNTDLVALEERSKKQA